MAGPTVGVSAIAAQNAGTSLSTGAVSSAASGSLFLIGFSKTTGGTLGSVTDSKGNTYTSVTSINEANDGHLLQLYKCENGTGGAGHTATVTVSTGHIYTVSLVEVLGAATSSSIEASNTKYNQTSPFDVSVTTLGTDRLVLSWIMTGQGTGQSWTANGGFSKFLQDATGLSPMAVASRAAATAAAYDPAWTNTAHIAMARLAISIIAPSGPTITSVSTATPREGASLTITGTAFGASQGAGNSTINSVSQTETSWGDTSIVATVVLGTNKFGAAYTVAVTDNSGTPSNNYAGITGLLPATSDNDYVDVGTPHVDATLRLTSTADAVSGDQVEWETKGGLVTVNSDLTFTADPGVASFRFRLWTSGSGYGAWATQIVGGGTGARRLTVAMGIGL